MADSRRRPPGPSRLGSMLVAVGCLGVLGATFMVGFYTGRYWTRSALLASAPEGSSAAAENTPRASRRPAPARPTPALTFYEELTAPLSPAAPLVKAAPAEPRRPAGRAPSPAPRQEERAVRADRRPNETPSRQTEPAAVAGSRFTVQIAAYSARASAEALRNSINASGHEAYVTETNGPPGAPRYRVRIGSYPSREAAVAAAARLPVPGGRYVTTR